MFDTLSALWPFDHRGRAAKWWSGRKLASSATPSATEMAARGEHNIGHLCRTAFGDAAYLVGFGTEPRDGRRRRQLGRAECESDAGPAGLTLGQLRSGLCHDAATPGVPAPPPRSGAPRGCATSSMRSAAGARDRRGLPARHRSCRATTSRRSCRRQFDEYIWFDETTASIRSGAGAAGGKIANDPILGV